MYVSSSSKFCFSLVTKTPFKSTHMKSNYLFSLLKKYHSNVCMYYYYEHIICYTIFWFIIKDFLYLSLFTQQIHMNYLNKINILQTFITLRIKLIAAVKQGKKRTKICDLYKITLLFVHSKNFK